MWSTHAAAMAICLLSVLALSQLHLVNSKSSGSGGGGKSSSGSSSGSSGSSKSTSSMSSSAKTSAAAAAGGTSKTSWGGGKSGGKWTFGGSTTKGGSTLYKGSGGRVYSSRPRYYGSGAHTSSGWVNRPIMYSAVAGATAFAFYGHSYARLPACGSYSGFFAYGNGCRSCRCDTEPDSLKDRKSKLPLRTTLLGLTSPRFAQRLGMSNRAVPRPVYPMDRQLLH